MKEVEYHLYEYSVEDESGFPRVLYFFRDAWDLVRARLDNKEVYERIVHSDSTVQWRCTVPSRVGRVASDAIEQRYSKLLSDLILGVPPRMFNRWNGTWEEVSEQE